jgi:large repetitive protein
MKNINFKIIFLLASFWLLGGQAWGQIGLQWVKRDQNTPQTPSMGKTGTAGFNLNETVRGASTDAQGNVYAVTTYEDTSAANTANNGNRQQVGIYKYDKQGNLVWRTKVTTTGNNGGGGTRVCGYFSSFCCQRSTRDCCCYYYTQSAPPVKLDMQPTFDIAVDTSGIYVSTNVPTTANNMIFFSASDLFNAAKILKLNTPSSGIDSLERLKGGFVIAKFKASNGDFLWQTNTETSKKYSPVTVNDIELDDAGNVYVAGNYLAQTSINMRANPTTNITTRPPVSISTPEVLFNSGSLGVSNLQWARTSCAAGVGYYYDVLPFQVSVSGSYTLNLCSTGSNTDTYAYLFKNSFTPGTPPCSGPNFIALDDDGNSNCGGGSRLNVSLVQGITYYLVTTSYSGGGTFPYEWKFECGENNAAIRTGAAFSTISTAIVSSDWDLNTNVTAGGYDDLDNNNYRDEQANQQLLSGQHPFVTSYSSTGSFRWFMGADLKTTRLRYCNTYCNTVTSPGASSYGSYASTILATQTCPTPPQCVDSISASSYVGVSFSNGKATSISIDNGNLYWAGEYEDAIRRFFVVSNTGTMSQTSFSASTSIGSSITTTTPPTKDTEGFVAQVNANNPNNVSFVKTINGKGSQSIQDVLARNGDLYYALELQSTKYKTGQVSNLDTAYLPSAGYYPIEEAKTSEVYIGQLNTTINPTFTPLWQQRIEPNGGAVDNASVDIQIGDVIEIDQTNESIYANGSFFGRISTLSMGLNLSTYPTIQTSVAISQGTGRTTDVWIAKFKLQNGETQWVKSFGGTSNESGQGIALSDKDIYIGGIFSSSPTDFEPSPGAINNLATAGKNDAFISKFGCNTMQLLIDSSSLPLCEGQLIKIKANVICESSNCSHSYEWIDPQGTTFTTLDSIIILSNLTGSQSRKVVVTDLNTGCVMKDSVNFSISPAVSLAVSPTTSLICDGNSIIFSSVSINNNLSYSWYLDGQLIPLNNSPAYTAFDAGAYTVKVNDIATGCSASASASLNKYQQLYPYFSPDTGLLCGNNVRLELLNCPGCNFTWTKPMGSNAMTSNSNMLSADIQGLYNVNAIDNNGCLYQRSISVLAAANLQPSIFAKDAANIIKNTICDGQPLLVQTTPCPSCTYQWSDGSTAHFTFAFSSGTYAVSVTNTLNGCSGRSTDLFIDTSLLPQPIINVINPSVCQTISPNNTAVARFSVANPVANCTYTWYNNNDLTSPLISSTNFNTSITGDYIVSATNNLTGCAEYSQPISINNYIVSKPIINASSTKICGGANPTLTTQSCINCTYQWYIKNPTWLPIVGANTAQNIATAPAAYKLEIQYPNGCALYSDSISIDTVSFAISITNSGVPYICNGDSISLFPTGIFKPSPTWTYQWFRNSSPIASAIGYIHTTSQPGSYALQAINENGCLATSDTLLVNTSNTTISPNLISSQSTLCAGDTVILTVSSATCVCSFEFFTSGAVTQGTASTSRNYVVPSSSLNRAFYVTVLDSATGCKENSNVIQIRDTFLPTPTMIALNNPICSSTGVILSTPAQASTQYIWQANGLSSTSTQNTFRVDSLEGNYAVRIKQGNCYSQFSNQIPVTFANFNAQLYVGGTGSTTICNGDSVRLSVFPTNPVFGRIKSSFPFTTVEIGSDVNSTLSIPSVSNGFPYADAGQIVGIQIDSIKHPNLSQLSISITPPMGSSVGLMSGVGSGNGAIRNLFLTDTATLNSITTVTGNSITGVYKPASPISGLTGSAAGKWTLLVKDTVTGDTGIVYGWSLVYKYNRYTYNWTINNNLIPNTSHDTVYKAIAAGSYRVDVRDSVTGCISSTLDIPIQSATASGTITASTTMKAGIPDTAYICGALGTTRMDVPPCAGCGYRWYRNGTLIPGANAANYSITGVASRAKYTAQIISGGCSVTDSIFLDTVPAFLDTITINPAHANICGGVPITMSESRPSIARQWFLGGTAISGIVAQQPQYQTNVAGAYYLVSVNTKGCSATTNSITTIASNPPVGFALVLNPLNPVPNTTPPISLNNYLQPVSIRGGLGAYNSATASIAINNVTDVFTPSIAGAGLHIISYTHTVSSCSFVVSDTIEVLESAMVDVENRRLLALSGSLLPRYESCLRDSLRFTVSNFLFAPNRIQFVTDTGLITITVSPVLVPNGVVFNGYVPVIVPNNARTGKVRLINGTDTFQTTFFLVVQNPAVSMNLVGVTQPICSNQGNVKLTAVPLSGATGRGRFAGAYLANSADTILTPLPRLVAMGGDSMIVSNVRNYDVFTGRQDLRLYYVFTPYYTGTTFSCPSISTSLDVEVRNVQLDSIEYTPIAITQTAESMFNLTRLVFPVSSRLFSGNYSGTYINNSNILPATISAGWGPQPVTYTISNSSCRNSIVDTVNVMSRPILDSIANYICRRPNDTIFIGRDAISMYIGVRMAGVINPTQRFNNFYTYQFNTRNVLDTFDYFERVNIMSLTSSNGGLTALNLTPGQELYALIPSNVTATATSLHLSFAYQKQVNYFDAASVTSPSNTVNYIIGTTQKTVNFEDLQPVTINPVILSNPVFCKENQIYQFSGSPNSGQYYLNRGLIRDTLVNNLFNPINYLTPSGINAFVLTYIYTGQACKDSSSTTIKIPRPFSITLTSPSAPNFCQEEANDTIQIISNISSFPAPSNSLNRASGVFYVGGVQSGQIFSPSLRGPGTYPVVYTVADSFGCVATDSDIFIVDSTPVIAMSPILPSFFCANTAAIPLGLSANGTNITGNFGTNTVTLTGRGVRNPLTVNPDYYPFAAVNLRRDTTLRDTITYTLVGQNGCTNSISQFTTIRELPRLALTVQGGAPVENSYCEGDSVRIVGLPLGGIFTDANIPNSINGFNALTGRFNPFIGSNVVDTNQMYLYAYTDINTTCRDTIRDTILIKNRAVLFIAGIVPTVCAKDTTILLGTSINTAAGPNIGATSGTFVLLNGNSNALFVTNTTTPTAEIYPDSAGIYDDSLRLRIRLNFSSNGCNSRVDTSFKINPLPQLTFNPPGDTLLSTANDRRFHICETADSVFMVARNRFRGSIAPIIPDTIRTSGFGFNGRGIRFRSFANGFVYFPDSAVSGIDTITYRYRDIRGCENIATGYTVIDTVPALGFAGFAPSKQTNQLIITSDSFAYCANDAGATIVPSPFGGFLYFQNTLQSGGIYNFIPDNLDTTPVQIYTLIYRYIAQRYANGRVCQDSVKTYVGVYPTPILNFIGVPTRVCVTDSTAPFPLQASPLGGFFQDATEQFNSNSPIVAGGILADTLFDPLAQQGNRFVSYRYRDSVTTCSDTITQQISIFRTPEVSFATGGGCQGDMINFQIADNQLSITPPAFDSITMYAWDFGNGVVDTVRPIGLNTRIVVPNRNYTFAAGGIYFPMLTVINQNQCVDSFRLRVAVSPKVTVTHDVPYVQDFEASPAEWIQETTVQGSLDSLWDWGIATGSRITTNQSRNHVWVTHLDDPYEVGERGWVYSPCFDISELTQPMIALDVWNDTRAGVDGAAVEYFHPQRGWVLLGERGKGRNWYDSLYLIAAPGIQIDSPQYAPLGWSGENLDGFKRAAFRLDTDRRNGDLRGMDNLRFRVAFASSDNTVVNGREGFAFDNVYIGDRQSSVLVEHFSNQNIAGIAPLENSLYSSLFNNLYGRDVIYMQYQTNLEGSDLYYDQAPSESNARMLYYGISSSSKKVRINGQDFVDLTQDLVRNLNNEREYLDMEMLREDTFNITIPTTPQIFQAATNATSGLANVTVTVTSTRNLPLDKYIVYAVITEDSLRSTQRHSMMGVVRSMQPNPSGTELPEQPIAPGDAFDVAINWTFSTATYRKSNLRLVIFVQNQATKQIYQVATSRDLSIFEGTVNVDELADADGKEILNFKLYPNPATENFIVSFDKALESEYEWRVTDALGQVVRNGRAQAGSQQFDINTKEFAAGMYIFSINNDKVYTQKQVVVIRP